MWVGPKIPKSDFLEVKEKILAEPERFICQKYIPLSQVIIIIFFFFLFLFLFLFLIWEGLIIIINKEINK